MKSILKKSYKISLSVIFLVVFLVILIVLSVFYFFFSLPDTWNSIIGSLIAGIIVALFQFLLSWQEYKATERIEQLKIKDVLINRDDKQFYKAIIEKAENVIDVMGVTGSRFVNDFANDDPHAPPAEKILFTIMSERGVKVRFIMPKGKHLKDEHRGDARRTEAKYQQLRSRYSGLFEIRYCDHVATHSIFRIDDYSIIGPVFPDVPSKYTPALYLSNTSPIAKKYLEYFETEWELWKHETKLE